MDFFLSSAPALTGASFFLGLLVGSFLNVVILRLPRRMQHEWEGQCRELLELESEEREAPPDLIFERSHCPICKNSIKAWHNIPLLSYLMLRGRCAECGEKISIRYPFVELLTGVASAIVVWHFGPTMEAAAALIFTWTLIALSGIDIDTQLLPDNLTLPLLWLGLLISLLPLFATTADAVIGAAAGYLVLWSIYHLFRLLTGKEGMGYGDFKLLAVLGAWLGWQMLPLIIFLSSVVGAAMGIMFILLRRNRKDQPFPFGPYLAAAGWIAMIYGDNLIDAYLSTLI